MPPGTSTWCALGLGSRRRPWRRSTGGWSPSMQRARRRGRPRLQGMTTPKRLMIIGLDCAAPEILFDDMKAELPVLNGLMERGVYGPLESCDPPITVPAWTCMMSSKDPGTLGFYGFRN